MQIGNFTISPALSLAPMAGVTDKPFRQICHYYGAGWVVGEMLSSDPTLRATNKSLSRADFEGEASVRVVQIAGSDPIQLANAARYNVGNGAQVIDINMGCPAKKVCNVQSGSALLQNEPLVKAILEAVVNAVDVPVTLKTRLGWHDEHKNILSIAKIAEQTGISALAIHGRTRTQMYRGDASYDLIAKVKQEINLPIWVNGDIDSPTKAFQVLQQTHCDGVMIGRAAQGQPWIFRDVAHFLKHGKLPEVLPILDCIEVVLNHISAIHNFYGEKAGVRIARKHIGWYLMSLPSGDIKRKEIYQLESAVNQYNELALFLIESSKTLESWPCAYR